MRTPKVNVKKAPAKRGRPAMKAVMARKSVRPSAEAPGAHYVTVDYPQEGEILTSPRYTFRVSTSAMEKVDISIDGRGFQPCRECVGFWWYDWSDFGAGAHTAVAKITAGRRVMKSKPRSFTVLI